MNKIQTTIKNLKTEIQTIILSYNNVPFEVELECSNFLIDYALDNHYLEPRIEYLTLVARQTKRNSECFRILNSAIQDEVYPRYLSITQFDGTEYNFDLKNYFFSSRIHYDGNFLLSIASPDELLSDKFEEITASELDEALKQKVINITQAYNKYKHLDDDLEDDSFDDFDVDKKFEVPEADIDDEAFDLEDFESDDESINYYLNRSDFDSLIVLLEETIKELEDLIWADDDNIINQTELRARADKYQAILEKLSNLAPAN